MSESFKYIRVDGRAGISAEIIADSIFQGARITTFRLIYPRICHSEVMTHRVFSRNAASTRAVPVKLACELVRNNIAFPLFYGKNQSGMRAENELDQETIAQVKDEWKSLAIKTAQAVEALSDLGLHKQNAGRPLEAFQFMQVILTATEFDNWEWLRIDKDAQPEIAELASCMAEARLQSDPVELCLGEWHVPFVDLYRDQSGILHYMDEEGKELSIQEALMVSASTCAQVSYRKSDGTLEKAKAVWERLIGSEKKHASPWEHQATPMGAFNPTQQWPDGVTHMDRNGNFWSGNFKKWIQHRQLVPGHVK